MFLQRVMKNLQLKKSFERSKQNTSSEKILMITTMKKIQRSVRIKYYLLICAMIYSVTLLQAQVTIKGPTCVVPGRAYHYVIKGNWDSTSTMQVCITGGLMKPGIPCSIDNKVVSSVFVTWNEGANGTISVKSSSGDVSLSVTGTKELNAGIVTATEREQTYSKGKSFTFHCSAATGGSCRPVYTYQWQKSIDGLSWTDISGSTGKDLAFTESILMNTFFRRVVTEKNSNTIGYSEIAQLTVVFPKNPGDSLYNGPAPKQYGN